MLRKVVLAILVIYGLLVLYSVISLSIVHTVPAFMTPLTSLTGFSFALLHAGTRLGWDRAFILLSLVVIVCLLFESVGVATGLVYGPYHYTDILGIRFMGLVPYVIAVAWFMMIYPSLVITEWIVPLSWKGAGRFICIAAIGGLVMTSWDVVMDPVMVAGGNWVWDIEGEFFGVPLQNYLGWWLTVFTCFVIYLLITRKRQPVREAKFDRLPLVAYMITGYSNVIIALTGGLGGPALAGFFALTPWVVWAWVSMGEDRVTAA